MFAADSLSSSVAEGSRQYAPAPLTGSKMGKAVALVGTSETGKLKRWS